jgi:hypothetical protein
MTRLRIPALVLALATAATLTACVAPDRAAAPEAGTPLALLGSAAPQLLRCNVTDAAGTATGVISPLLGGTVAVGGFSISLPAGSVLSPTTITVTVPESPYVEIDIRANGLEHFQFLRTATVTMSYAGCSGTGLLSAPLSAWYIDSATKTPIAQMISVDNKLTRKVTFVTNHLSGYAIVNRETAGTGEPGAGEGQ